MRTFVALAALLAVSATGGSGVYPPPAQPGKAVETSPRTLTPPPDAPLKEVAPGVFQIGLVELNRQKRSVSFPAAVNMQRGEVEYVLVTEIGKLHESVFKTDASPLHLHMAALLLKPRDAPPPKHPPEDPTLAGEKISIWATWPSPAGERHHRIEDFVTNTRTESPMTHGAWIYNGSRIIDGVFIVQRDGSIVSIIIDPDALINNPRPGREIDYIWHVREDLTPPVNTPVRITLQFEEQ